MKAHLFSDPCGGRWIWRFSGYQASGDPFDGAGAARSKTMKPRPFDAVVDVPGEFTVTEDGRLYVRLKGRVWAMTAEGVYLAAKLGHFGFSLAPT